MTFVQDTSSIQIKSIITWVNLLCMNTTIYPQHSQLIPTRGTFGSNAEVANSCHKINFMTYLKLAMYLTVIYYVANNDPVTLYKWHQDTKRYVPLTHNCTLFIAWPMWGFPLAKGGPSCRINSGPWTCFLCQLYRVENSHFWKQWKCVKILHWKERYK